MHPAAAGRGGDAAGQRFAPASSLPQATCRRVVCSCAVKHLIPPTTTTTSPPCCPQFSGPRDVPYQGGQTVLDFYGLGGASAWLFLLYESLFFWVFAALTWAALAFWRHQRR